MNNTHATPALYELENIGMAYGSRYVLRDISLKIFRGEVFALVGPSGSGKSTLLRLLNFIENPTNGNICFLNQSFNSVTEMPIDLRRKVTTVFQRPMLLNRSVYDNVQFGLALRGQHDNKELVHATLEQVGLAHLANQRARTLSGGEAQRVALARAMVLQPEVLLLDEPTANLDPSNVALIENIIQTINDSHKTTIVVVTHNIFQAKRLAGRVAFLLDGSIVEVAGAQKFFQDPQDTRTQSFVKGEMIY